MKFTHIAFIVVLSGVTACSTPKRSPDSLLATKEAEESVAKEEAASRGRYQPADPDFYKNAYEQGVRDTVREFKSRMRARSQFVWEPPIVQEVWVPGRVVGGTFYPGHSEKVIVSPGRWVEENGVPAPEPGSATLKSQ